jgi:hypothetical protein
MLSDWLFAGRGQGMEPAFVIYQTALDVAFSVSMN